MKIIDNKEEFDDFRPYKSTKLSAAEYPECYPCIAVIYEAGGGLMGEYQGVYAEYPPTGADINLYFSAFRKGYECCRNYE